MEDPKVHHSRRKHRRSSSRSSARREIDNEIREDDEEHIPESREENVVDVEQSGKMDATPLTVVAEVRPTELEIQQPTVAGVAAGVTAAETTTAAAVANESGSINEVTGEKLHTGIMTYVDREMKVHKKQQSLSDPTASPAQRSTRSRSSLEKSPRRKRSKSESRRRRERKMIAAGELEVRQANETLLRYLKQCTEINDASLSGELEIDKSIEDRRVHRKTKSQRERRAAAAHNAKFNGSRERIPPSGLTTILNDLVDDIMPSHGEIYNPFTPVISPTEGPTRIDKMFIQTSRGYRSVDHSFYKVNSENDLESNRPTNISNSVQLSCFIQRIWILVANICHGLLGGMALAHLLFISTTRPYEWAEESIRNYSAFAEIYANTFYCLIIVCMVSVCDRLDICRLSLSNASESISFRWVIIVMVYLGTIILSLSAESMDEKIYLKNFNVTTILEEEMQESNRALSIWNSLSMARSVGAILGWILIGLTPADDLLYEHLIEMEKYQLNNN